MIDLMTDLWEEIKWNWGICVIVAIVLFCIIGFCLVPVEWFETEQSPAVITQQAEGTIVNIRGTGAWENWCKIELKFDDGTVLLVSYGFIKKYNIRERHRYSICDNSWYGRTAMELK